MHVLADRVLELDFHAALLLDAVELQQEIGVEEGAAELAVGDRLEAQALLIGGNVANRVILDRAQSYGVDRAGLAVDPGVDQRLGAQKAADMIGVKWGLGGARCGNFSVLHRLSPDVEGAGHIKQSLYIESF